MKKILFLLLLWSTAYGQSPYLNYTYFNTRSHWYNGAFTGLHVPGFNGTPALVSGQSIRDGAVGMDTTTGTVYFYWNSTWNAIGAGGGGDNNFTSNIVFTNNRLTLSRTGLSDLTADFDTARWHTYAFYNNQYYPLSSNPSNYLVAADIAGKLNISDTGTMLNPYLRKVDSAAMLAPYMRTAEFTGVPSSRTLTASSPITGGGDLSANRSFGIQDGVADGSTKGAVSFTAADFNTSSGNVSLDYTNGQAASGSNKGYLTSADWTTFNSKIGAGDTADMLNPYLRKVDTLAMLAEYLRKIDTVSLSARIDLINSDNSLGIMNALGSNYKGQTLITNLYNSNGTLTLVDNQERYVAIKIDKPGTITGVKWFQTTAGNYTADQNNYVALYTYSAGTMTRIAISANDGDIWKVTSNNMGSVNFVTPVAVNAGLHFIGMLYNNSAQTTAPVIAGNTNIGNSARVLADFTNSAKVSGTVSGGNTLPTSRGMGGVSAALNLPWFGVF